MMTERHADDNSKDTQRSEPTRERATAETVFERTIEYAVALADLDVIALRDQFATLMDAAAHATFLKRLDLDDVIVKRSIICQQPGGPPTPVPARWLADGARLADLIRETLDAPTPTDIRITALCIHTLRSIDP